MSENRKKFEYKLVTIGPSTDPEEALNTIGEEGWWIVGVLPGALHDDIGHARVLLVREKA